jgi:hypothetical protein
MKLYKLWIDIEEHDLENGKHRSLVDSGEAVPVAIAEFSDLEMAAEFAQALSLDQPIRDAEQTVSTN